MKYTTKDQDTIENLLAIHLHAYDKAQLRAAEADDAVAAGRKCVQSMCCSLSNAQEVSAPLAALYLERESPFYLSTEFVNLHVSSYANAIFKDSAVDVTLTQGHDSAYVVSSSLLDYINRPEELETLTLMDFNRLYKKKPNQRGLRFMTPHTQCTSHSIHARSAPVVACLLGKRLPDMRNPNVSKEQRVNFQQHMMIRFRPFHRVEDFGVDSNTSLDAEFRLWWQDAAPNEAHRFLLFSNDCYASRELARNKIDDDTERVMNCVSGSEDKYFSGSDSDSVGEMDEYLGGDDLWDDTALLRPSTLYTNLITNATEAADLAAVSQETPVDEEYSSLRTLTAQQLDHAIAETENEFIAREQSSHAEISHRVEASFPTRVQILRNALEGANAWRSPAIIPAQPELHLTPSLADVSRKFNLNRKQHKAFVRVGEPFLQSLLSESDDDIRQVIAFLGGGPGTGKSQVIRALQELASSWLSRDALKTVAYQGVAAEAVNGQTIQNLFKWGIEKGSRHKRYSIKDKEAFASLKLLIMDEVSTTDASIIGMMDSALRELKNEPHKRFGGIHVLFAGDWLQQLPVAGYPVFIKQPPPPGFSKTSISPNANDETAAYLLRQRGIDAYREINEVVMLDEKHAPPR